MEEREEEEVGGEKSCLSSEGEKVCAIFSPAHWPILLPFA